jgi:type IV pilus assembly protein PilA
MLGDVKKGFTLVELLVVVEILGVLAAVGIVAYSGFLGKAKENLVIYNQEQENLL